MPKRGINIKIDKDNRAAFLAALPGAVQRSLNDIGDAIVKNTSANAPKDTGALAASYEKSVDSGANRVSVGSALDYAPYVELGTGPNYETPPAWVTNRAKRGHHAVDPWWYLGKDGEWHLGWFIQAIPHLRPAFLDNAGEYSDIFKKNLENA